MTPRTLCFTLMLADPPAPRHVRLGNSAGSLSLGILRDKTRVAAADIHRLAELTRGESYGVTMQGPN